MKYFILIIFLLSSAYIFYEGLRDDQTYIPSNLISEEIPEFKIESIKQYESFSSADLKSGEIKVVNFFASWCPPCKVEHPQLKNEFWQDQQIVRSLVRKMERKRHNVHRP